MEETIFTSAGVLDLLSQIDELKDYDINLDDNNGEINLTIGDSTYKISKPKDTVEVSEDALSEISDIADNAIDGIVDEPETIESGIIDQTLQVHAYRMSGCKTSRKSTKITIS